MRYILAIAGLLVAALVAVAITLLLPRADGGAGGNQAAVAQDQPPAATPEAAPATEPGAEPLAAEAAGGSLRVCNETSNQVSIAFGYKAPRGWQSEGWWVAAKGECKTIYSGDLETRRYYYLYAADDVGGGVWDGTVYMCTRDETFTIFGVEDCLARGYERTGFFEVDTQNKSDWTLQLTDGETVGGETDAVEEALPLEGELPDAEGTGPETSE